MPREPIRRVRTDEAELADCCRYVRYVNSWSDFVDVSMSLCVIKCNRHRITTAATHQQPHH